MIKVIKLPRKRKKKYIKDKGKANYIAVTIFNEILVEEGRKNGERYYNLKIAKTSAEMLRSKNGILTLFRY